MARPERSDIKNVVAIIIYMNSVDPKESIIIVS